MNGANVLDLILPIPLVSLSEECVTPTSAHLFRLHYIFQSKPFKVTTALEFKPMPCPIIQDKGGANICAVLLDFFDTEHSLALCCSWYQMDQPHKGYQSQENFEHC